MKFHSPLIDLLLKFIKNPKKKTIIVIGVHDDRIIKELAPHFKKVHSYYEFLKINNKEGKNFVIKKELFTKTINRLKNFDIIFIYNEMHHFPDIYQMEIYNNLRLKQKLMLIEPLNNGTFEDFYIFFQDCKPLCFLTQSILKNFVKKRMVKIEKTKQFKKIYKFDSLEDLRRYIKFELPDHFKFGKEDFENKLKKTKFPVKLTENAKLIQISRI
jgi:hypothetical protein